MMREERSVAIDSVSESPVRQPDFDAIVLVDVLCDTTVLVTSASQRRQTFPAASAPAALYLARGLRDPLLATSESETWRAGFEMHDSPAALARRSDTRPFVLACATGATLAAHALGWPDIYLLCLRNVTATARHLALRHNRVLILDATDDSDIRCEDQIAAAQLAVALGDTGFSPLGLGTRETMARWGGANPGLAAWGRSAERLRRWRRDEDLEFVLSHVDDLDVVCTYANGHLKAESTAEPREISGIA
jgi:phosphosulfolactate phosphohydrolase-like enzyme